ncbi:MAG: LysM peptidoglycan-binding domain-containing protein, partial [Terriglobales bacterium]
MGRLAINGSAWPTFSPDTASPNTVIVKQGDTLEKIAKSLNVDLKDLMAANGIKGPNQTILAGQELNVPPQNSGAVPAPKEPLQVHSSPMGGTVDPAWEGKHQLRNATIHDLTDKAYAAGLDAGTVSAMVAKLGTMPDSQLVRSASLLQHSLNSANANEQFINTLVGLGVQGAGGRIGVGEAEAGGAAAGGAAEAGKAGASAG